jgi:hypothetical protein
MAARAGLAIMFGNLEGYASEGLSGAKLVV